MTGGWGKKVAAFILGAAAIGTAEKTADAQQASVGVSGTQQAVTGFGTGVQQTAGTAQNQPQALQNDPALRVEGSFRSTLEVDDNGGLRPNSPGTDTTFFTTFGIAVFAETPVERFNLRLGADLEFEDRARGREENGIESPTLRFQYVRDGADSQLTASGRYRTDDIFDSFFFDSDGDLIEDTLLQSDGDRTDRDLNLGYSFGLQAPFGMDFGLGRRERTYKDVVSPNLFDRRTDSVDVTARFRINPAVTARAFVNQTYYEAEDGGNTERDTTDYGVGVRYEIRPDLSFDGQVSATDIEEVQTFGANQVVRNRDGYNATIGLTRSLTNGTLAFTAQRDQSINTARTSLRFDRSLTLPNGALSFGAGVSDSDTGDTSVIASLNYSNQLASGTISANLRRTTVVNQSNDEVTRTTAGVNYIYPINVNSSMNFGINFAEVESAGVGGVTEGRRADLRVGYRRQLTEDWDWTLGYVNRYRSSGGGSSARSNAIETSIGRSFSIRP